MAAVRAHARTELTAYLRRPRSALRSNINPRAPRKMNHEPQLSGASSKEPAPYEYLDSDHDAAPPDYEQLLADRARELRKRMAQRQAAAKKPKTKDLDTGSPHSKSKPIAIVYKW